MATSDKRNHVAIRCRIKNQIYKRLYSKHKAGCFPAVLALPSENMIQFADAAASAVMHDDRLNIILKKGV